MSKNDSPTLSAVLADAEAGPMAPLENTLMNWLQSLPTLGVDDEAKRKQAALLIEKARMLQDQMYEARGAAHILAAALDKKQGGGSIAAFVSGNSQTVH